MNVAVFFMGIGDVSGGGGAERFFADFFTDYRDETNTHNLFLLTDKSSIAQFNKINKITDFKNVHLYKVWNNRFKNRLEFYSISKFIVSKKIKVIMMPLYNIHYYPLVERISQMPKAIRPKIVPVIVDYNISYYYFNDMNKGYNYQATFSSLFNSNKIDAIITWYQSFKDFCQNHKIIKNNPPVYTVTSRYSPFFETLPYKQKKNHIVFAGRLTETKRPLMFLEAVNLIKNESAIKGWHFFVYGRGVMENDVKNYIENNSLSELVTLSSHPNPKEVLATSKCFVSTQDFENFPSLAMNEAMVAGNAVIARNVGQTNLFVTEGQNGFLLNEDTTKDLARKMLDYILLSDSRKEELSNASIELTKTVHTYVNFKSQMENIWHKILNAG
jgi:glycosyltransferase involved in cell wall biosynthesis